MKIKVRWSLVLIAIAAAGCAQQPVGPSRESHRNNAATIAQIGYGPAAKYVTCPLDGCAQPTHKTIANEPAPQAAAPEFEPTKPVAPEPAPGRALALVVPAAPVIAAATTPTPVVASASASAPAPVPASAPPLTALPIERLAESRATQPVPRVDAPAKPAVAKAAVVDPEFVLTESSSGHQRVFIGFPSGSARLTKDAKAKLGLLAPQVLGAERVVIKGRTDERGNADSNDRLALRRAMAVYEYLRRTARATDKPFKLLAKGACCYIARNITEDGRAANRRAEIDFVSPMQAAVTPPRRAPIKGQPS